MKKTRMTNIVVALRAIVTVGHRAKPVAVAPLPARCRPRPTWPMFWSTLPAARMPRSGKRPHNRRRRTDGRGRSATPFRGGEMRDPSPGLLAAFEAPMQPCRRSRRPNAGLTYGRF
jgi:hypothetical protein